MNPRVSIAINNYNYDRFIKATIDSALAQTYANLEVIVVDDGSTDQSWSIIQSYGDRIKAVRTGNGGQGAAYNKGFELCTGEFIFFLDSDDTLDPSAIERCVAMVTPDVSKVQFRLRTVDAGGNSLGGFVPYLMHDGNVRDIIEKFGHYAGPPASGNFYRRSAIERYFPMPAPRWKRASDTVPFLLSAFHGTIASIDESLGSYRLHKRANSKTGLLGNMNKSIADGLKNEIERRDAALALLLERSGIKVPGPFLMLPTSMRSRALCWKLEPHLYPYANESAGRLLRDLGQALRAWPGYNFAERSAMRLWITIVACSPHWVVTRIAAGNNSGGVRSMLKKLAGSNGLRT